MAEPAFPGQRLQGFEAQLTARTKVPSERLQEFLGWSEERVRREARVVTRVLKRFAEAVIDSMEDASGADRFLAELDLKIVSRDHDWRAIFASVRAQQAEVSEPYQRAVLVKYLQYLSFRKQLLDYIHASKAGLKETDELCSGFTQVQGGVVADEDGLCAFRVPSAAPPDFERIPLGETVDVRTEQDEAIELVLGRHRFELVASDHPYFVDKNGVTCFVKPGRNMVGRHPESDLKVDANFGDISRAHLILEWGGGRQFRLLDLSSRGTYLRASVLQAARAIGGPQDLVQGEAPPLPPLFRG